MPSSSSKNLPSRKRRGTAQQLFLAPRFRPRFEHGGAIRKGRRKLERPFDPKQALHVVMRASRARGKHSMQHHRNRARVHKWLYQWSARAGVRVVDWANVGNHLHLIVKAGQRENLQKFLRGFAGQTSMGVLGGRKGHKTGRFWDSTAYSRVVRAWGKAFESLRKYVHKNQAEALGFDRIWLDEVFREGGSLQEILEFDRAADP